MHTVRPCLSDDISFLTFCWINEVAGLTNHDDAHVHMYIKMKHFFLVRLEIPTFGAPFAYMRIYGVGTSKQSVRTCDSLCAKMTVGVGNQVLD